MPYATVSAAYDDAMGFFETGYAAAFPTNAPLVQFQDQKIDTPKDDETWLRLLYTVQRVPQVTINTPGNRRFRSFGKLTFEVRTPLGNGLTTSQQMQDSLLGIFEGQTINPGGTIFRECVATNVGPDGSWYLARVVVSFEFDRFR